MGSSMFAVECPCCGRSAIEDFHNTGERYVFCLRCGYSYSMIITSSSTANETYEEKTYDGNGVLILFYKDGQRKSILLSHVPDDRFESCMNRLKDDTVDQEKSYLVAFQEGVFTVLAGNPPENFHLSFADYKKKMVEKYGEPEFGIMVPIEE